MRLTKWITFVQWRRSNKWLNTLFRSQKLVVWIPSWRRCSRILLWRLSHWWSHKAAVLDHSASVFGSSVQLSHSRRCQLCQSVECSCHFDRRSCSMGSHKRGLPDSYTHDCTIRGRSLFRQKHLPPLRAWHPVPCLSCLWGACLLWASNRKVWLLFNSVKLLVSILRQSGCYLLLVWRDILCFSTVHKTCLASSHFKCGGSQK